MKIQQELEIAECEQPFRINKENLKDDFLTCKNIRYLERKIDDELNIYAECDVELKI